jgi:CRISPR/Cas system CMR subunit Cmr4 (Cas7 group RAMP superfamily)
MTIVASSEIISQDELNNLLQLNEFIENQKNQALVSEIKKAILDSGKLQLEQWESLRDHIREVEELIPHIDLIIKLKKEK